MEQAQLDTPPGYGYSVTAFMFSMGALVTAIFSGSLAILAVNAELPEVLAVGMIVPSFTWVVQMAASGLCLDPHFRQVYWGDLARICLLGSVALIPAAAANMLMPNPPLWPSAANVLVSVAVMAIVLFRRSAAHGISLVWPVSWCLTIALNMALFVWTSRGWW